MACGPAPDVALPVTICVGESEFTKKTRVKTDDLNYGAYRIQSGDGYLALIGNDDNYFMDKPGDGGEVCDERNHLRELARLRELEAGEELEPAILGHRPKKVGTTKTR